MHFTLAVSLALQDDEGVVRVEFPQKIPGHRDFLLLDEELQITIGNRGGYVAVKRKT